MRLYVAAKFEDARRARAVMDFAQTRGHVVTHDWTGEDSTGLEGAERSAYMGRCAVEDLEGVRKADAVVVLAHPALFGGMVEVGVAIGLGIPVYVVGAESRECVFWFLDPSEIELCDSVEDALMAAEADWAIGQDSGGCYCEEG